MLQNDDATCVAEFHFRMDAHEPSSNKALGKTNWMSPVEPYASGNNGRVTISITSR